MFSICVWPLATEMEFCQHEQKSMLNYLKHNFHLKPQKYVRAQWSSATSPVLSDEGTEAQKGEVSFLGSPRKLIMVSKWDPGLLTPRLLFSAFSLLTVRFPFQPFKGNSDSMNKRVFLLSYTIKIQNQLPYSFPSDFIGHLSIFPRKCRVVTHKQGSRCTWLSWTFSHPGRDTQAWSDQ